MYRIKLASGNETTYNSIDELTAAVEDGEVDTGALIYHQRADRWLSITNHPHYVIALSRIQAPAKPATADASRRQVVPAIRPAAAQAPASRSETELPPTVVRDQSPNALGEEKGQVKVAKRLTIPNVKKPNLDSPLRAQENVLDGVVIEKPAPTNENGNGHAATNGNGAPPKQHQTTALPYRAAAPVVPARVDGAPKVPDRGDGLDLVEPETSSPGSSNSTAANGNGTHPESTRNGAQETPETPEVDKLLSLLESSGPAPVTTPVAPKPSAAKAPLEVIDLGPPPPTRGTARKAEPVLDAPMVSTEAPLFDARARAESARVPVIRARHNWKPAIIGIATVSVLTLGLVFWHPWGGGAAQDAPADVALNTPRLRNEAFGGQSSAASSTAQASTPAGSPGTSSAQPVDSAIRSAKPQGDSAPSIIRVVAPRVKLNIPLPSGQLMDANGAGDGAKTNIPASALAQHYIEAYNDARSELELRMLQIGFTQIFLRSRLTTTSGLQDTRRLIGSAASALRQYRAQEARIERAYQDTVGAGGRNLGWTPRDLGTWNTRTSQREAPETMRLTNLLLSQMDSVFSLLQDQDGKYQISGESIAFSDPESARQYGTLRAWLTQQADSYSGSGEMALPGTLRQVIKAIGTTRLPQERRG